MYDCNMKRDMAFHCHNVVGRRKGYLRGLGTTLYNDCIWDVAEDADY
jgi:hypothetical protein